MDNILQNIRNMNIFISRQPEKSGFMRWYHSLCYHVILNIERIALIKIYMTGIFNMGEWQ